VCLLKRFVADYDLAATAPFVPEPGAETGKRVAVVGAGPTGLSAAYYLRTAGHACVLLDAADRPGGMLRRGVPASRLPRDVIDAEAGILAQAGVEFRMSTELGKHVGLDAVTGEFEAVVLATGAVEDTDMPRVPGVDLDRAGIRVQPGTYATSEPRVFAAGAAVRPTRLAVRAVALGREVALAVTRFLSAQDGATACPRFDSRVGPLLNGEPEQLLQDAANTSGRTPVSDAAAGYTAHEARLEAGRCMHCDCRKRQTCALRRYAELHGSHRKHYAAAGRAALRRIRRDSDVVFEPGKCIKCGICVRLTSRAGERLGLTFVGRGIDAGVAVPFGEPLSAGLKRVARECVESCPTGALAWAGEEG
jgi:ferredoxin